MKLCLIRNGCIERFRHSRHLTIDKRSCKTCDVQPASNSDIPIRYVLNSITSNAIKAISTIFSRYFQIFRIFSESESS